MKRRAGGWASWAGRISSWLLLFAAVGVLAAVVVVPRISGSTPYTVLTGSMQPSLPPGELVVMAPADPASIRVGQVAAYQLESGRPAVATHRVAAVRVDGHGERSFVFRGDANSADDPEPVRPEQLRGVLWYHLPLLGHVNLWLTGEQRMLGVGLAAGTLLLYAAVVWIRAARRRLRSRSPA
ncbi:signal peptidase I [Herbiconiux sp. CPCC 203407]|uniref:Signal peptidase I n=1 Tax=Herbiconiux oxytropis TaxID=2970915 RepID=A0AA41XDK2_9MICO|nr:signal peptidase I [Herbiconiux oxytropis]MCS5721436.1 signal peptidase I [Herbiconiux oxytropis]MCS5724513.1 signal peptidase I [Herbiconiux oxytropis]